MILSFQFVPEITKLGNLLTAPGYDGSTHSGSSAYGKPVRRVPELDSWKDTQKAKGRSHLLTSSFVDLTNCLVEAEVHFHVDLNCHRFAVFHCRLEGPTADRFDSFLVESHAKAARN